MPSKSPVPGIMAVPRAGANGADANTRGADTDNCTSSVNPYVNIARVMAPLSPSPVRPITPKSTAHPPAAFVGVVMPKTGPCPEAYTPGAWLAMTAASAAVITYRRVGFVPKASQSLSNRCANEASVARKTPESSIVASSCSALIFFAS